MKRLRRCGLVALLLCSALSAQALPTFDEVKRDFKPSDTLLLDRNGEVLQRLRTDRSVRRGQWVALADVSPALRTALVLSEDKRFYEHSGVDWRAVSAAAWGNLWNTRTRGASTLSMQLAGLLDEDWRAGASGRSLTQKIGQTVAAQRLESHWRKDQILEAYLNLVPFRGELIGIDALSRTLFGKAAHGLDEREAAVAAALVRAPNAKAAQVAQRACGVLKLMQAPAMPLPGAPALRPMAGTTASMAVAGNSPARPRTPAAAVDCEGLDLFATGALQRRDFEASQGIAPHLARRLLALDSARGKPPSRPFPEGARGQTMQENATLPPPGALKTGRSDGSATPDNGKIHSTLRADVQRLAVQSLRQQLRELQGRHVEDGAIVVLDNASGAVLAWVGSSGEISAAAEVDGVLALRQPGSTLKPFLYAQAIAERRMTAASLLEDSSSQIQTSGGLYIPQNYDRLFKGLVSARTALGASLNVPAVRTLVMVSPEAFHRQLRAVGLPLKESGDYYGYSLALGSAEVSLLALTNAYRTLANGGQFSEVQFQSPPAPPAAKGGTNRSAGANTRHAAPAATDAVSGALADPGTNPAGTGKSGLAATGALPRGGPAKTSVRLPALDARAAFITADILADPLARARTFGTDSVLATRFWTAVKTGTSKDMRDNWALGFSERYTVGVWVGNASGAPMWDVSGTSGAAPIWAALMNHLHQHEPSRAPAPPAGLVQSRVEFGNQLEAARTEWFIQGTEQAIFAANSGASQARPQSLSGGARGLKNAATDPAGAPRITAPASGTILALDPDIPPTHQRLTFSAEGRGLRWRMDGKEFGRGNEVRWLPWPGRHVVQLLDASGKPVDEIRLEVRGAGVKAAGR
ncbi:MAG: transglycosylase domain-containing protein [Pseudomonadota bacterium]|nr:transglycosylase domain-containing protein [Pseudomonadota bacterium]